MDANARKKRGFGIAQYLKDLNDAGKRFQTRTGIADDDPKNEALQQFAKVIQFFEQNFCHLSICGTFQELKDV